MKLIFTNLRLSVCKMRDFNSFSQESDFFFLEKTGREFSLVCETKNAPSDAVTVESGWRCFYIDGTLDFSLVGILAKISTILAQNHIGIFAVSTFDTDYVLVKEESYIKASDLLKASGYEVEFDA